ncbi:DUF4919 domain-containing protein [Flavobacterium celericrescens]|uniref:DUF4919 domain-containing protein n=1 Tax=Flavobacterium celericrescens TaxID=2709780 RepID=A0ABX0IB31_9FLAO|nr:DUF4919 domain-containing protein [Flavobacterium celericrescens]NHM04282.1 DUF4919 domain-containing protein [Flavobacterium celericrescens]
MKKLLTLVLTILSFTAYSQELKFEKPNYNKIEKEIEKKSSSYYYEKLKEKFNSSDSTMTLEEKRHLYYGFSFQKEYSSSYHNKANDSLMNILNKEDYSTDDFKKIIEFGNQILSENPFDLRVLNYQLYAYEKMQEKDNYMKKLTQFTIIVDAILSSGDGTSKENAIYVINVSHEYDILNIIGFEFGGSQSLIAGQYDYLKVKENKFKIDGLYFDISPSIKNIENMFKD